jgi:hypothetical protein
LREWDDRYAVRDRRVETILEQRWTGRSRFLSVRLDEESLIIVRENRRIDGQPADAQHGQILAAWSSSGRGLGKVRDHRLRFDGVANTLNTSEGCRNQSTCNYVVNLARLDDGEYPYLRHLSPEECEAVMGWEPGITAKALVGKHIGESTMFEDNPAKLRWHMCGNGVVPAMALHAWATYFGGEP